MAAAVVVVVVSSSSSSSSSLLSFVVRRSHSRTLAVTRTRRYPPYVTGGALIMRAPSPYTGLTAAVLASSSLTASPSLSPMLSSSGGGGDSTLSGSASFPLQLSDTFKLNRNFSSRLQKIVLEEPLALAQFQELLVTAAVKRIRELTVRSAVMRVIKPLRECSHKELAARLPSVVTQFKVTSRVRRRGASRVCRACRACRA
jgi:hypothetical protein